MQSRMICLTPRPPHPYIKWGSFEFGSEVGANVFSSDESISRHLLYFLKCIYEIGPYCMGMYVCMYGHHI